MRNKAISILFCLILAVGAAAHILTADRFYSENEKRTLKQLPKASWEQIRSGRFGSEIEDYLADQFPGRNNWVALRTAAERLLGKKESGGVYFADDGYLIEIHKEFSAEQTAANVSALLRLQDALAENGVSMRTMLVPTAGEILSDKLPKYAPNADQSAVIEYAVEQGLHIVDVTEALREHGEEYIFYKTDHHWTSLGSYYAYASWMLDRGAAPDPVSAWKTERLCENFRGTSYAKVNDPSAAYDAIDAYYRSGSRRVDYNNGDYITDSIYERKYLDGTNQYAVFLNSNQSVTAVSGDGTGRCLILKDSFANCFAQFCVDDFEETHLIDMRFFRGSVQDYIKEHGIGEVLVLYNIPNFTSDTDITRCCEQDRIRPGDPRAASLRMEIFRRGSIYG